ncbi:hypothetical protein DITRI_Ditri02bG0020300 [Diplodiscus trichospermus]
MDVVDRRRSENEARVTAENSVASLTEELEKAQEDIAAANERAATLDNTNKRLQEYNLSLHEYNSNLITDLRTFRESLKRVEQEKLTIVENLSTLRGHCSLLQEQLTLSRGLFCTFSAFLFNLSDATLSVFTLPTCSLHSVAQRFAWRPQISYSVDFESFGSYCSQSSQDDAVNQKQTLVNEVKCLRGELQEVRDDREGQVSQVQDLSAEIEMYKESSGKSFAELDNLTMKSKSMEEACSSQREQIRILELQLAAANEKLKMADLSASETRMEYLEQKRIIQKLQDRVAEMEYKLTEGENLRKKLHNTILELKGNIRVFCWVRPLLPDDGAEGAVESLGRGIDLIQSGQKYPFTFDKVFNHEASQQDVFVEISQLVQSALDGYKILRGLFCLAGCIFAYGQTGSGKTYTMMGRPEAPEQKGLIPRSLEQIFESSQSLQAQGWKYKMQASMLEIYNETIRVLLSTNRSTASESAVSGKQYTIKHDANGNTYVSDLTIVDVSSITEISSLLKQAAQSRSVGRTQMNEHSSRRHMSSH